MNPGTVTALVAAGLGLMGALTAYLKARTAQIKLGQHIDTPAPQAHPPAGPTSG